MTTLSNTDRAALLVIVEDYAATGVTPSEVAGTLAAMEKVRQDYPTRCAQTPLIAAAIGAKTVTAAKVAQDAGISAMQVGRYRAAGSILIAHPNLDPEAVVAYANTHDKKDCAAIEAMTEEQAQEAISPKKASKGSKSDAEKDQEALTRLLGRIRRAHEDGDAARLDAIRTGLYLLSDALEGVESVEDVA